MRNISKKYLYLIVCFFIFTGLSAQNKKNFTLEELFTKRTFFAKGVPGFESLNDGQFYTSVSYDEDKNASIIKYNFGTGEKVETIVEEKDLVVDGTSDSIKIEDYQFNSDETKILFSVTKERIYRYSATNDYFVFDLKTKKLNKTTGKPAMYAAFSPDGNKISYVRDNNLFYFDLNNNSENQITSDGKKNNIINGSADWVYEEEFGLKEGFIWSPNSDKIAFFRFDESNVREYTYIDYDSLYPSKYSYKYPKAGEDNSIVDVYVYEISTAKLSKVDLGEDKNIYIPRIKWTNDNDKFCIMKLNRLQNAVDVILVNAMDISTKVILHEENKYYLNINELSFLKNNNFIWQSERDGFNHLYLYNLEGLLINQITKGKFDVSGLTGVDEKGLVYFSTSDNEPMERYLYSIKLDGSDKKKLTPAKGFNAVQFNKDYTYYIGNYSNINEPGNTSIYKSSGEPMRKLEDNSALKKKLEDYNIGKYEFFKFKTSENIELDGWMVKPVDYDAEKKYPVIIYVYGGPGANTVTDIWQSYFGFWFQYMTQQGFVVVSVDGRGTSGKGEEFKKCTYMQLGKYETEDMIETAKYLGSLSHIDKNKIGIFGWSYGGYMSAMCITKGADYFNTAVAVAPVTNWRYYDNIYMERYMRTPQENASGYDDNSPINYVDKIKGNFLMIHGTSDDNVHFQNSVEMVKAMIKANKKFDSEYYPDKNHNIGGGLTRLHLFTRISEYFIKNMK
jgi:dipeptidyl-peptidase-4